MADVALAQPTVRPIAQAGGAVRRPAGLFALALLAPSLVFLFLFTYWPIAQVLGHSLGIGVAGQSGLSLDAFQRLLADEAFGKAVLNNLVYAVGTIVPSIAIALALAVGLRESTGLNASLRTIVFFPVLIPLVAAAALFLFIFMPGLGLMDHYLAKLGARSTNWLGNPDTALAAIILITIWKNAGYYMLFYLAGLQAIPQDLYDAAMLEGAGPWQRFRLITLPLLGPTTAFVLVIALVNIVTQVDHVVVLTKGGPSNATNLVLFYIYQQAHENHDLAKAAAATTFSVAALLGLSLVSLRTLERGTGHGG